MDQLGSDVLQKMQEAKETPAKLGAPKTLANGGGGQPATSTPPRAKDGLAEVAGGGLVSGAGNGNLKEVVKAKEQMVSKQLMEKQRRLQKEGARLHHIEQELEQLRRQEADGINTLRAQLERIDKALVWLESDCKQKQEAYQQADEALKSKVAEKEGVQRDLTNMILSSEKKKESKLNELITKMDV